MLEITLGFLIALAVGLTGVGAGSVTAPVLILLLHVPAPIAVGTALIYAALIKIVALPSYLWRKQVNFNVLGWLLVGGLPGALIGSLLMKTFHPTAIYGVLGATIMISAALNIWRVLKGHGERGTDHRRWLPAIAFPIGAEVGFSSAGAGALGSLVLLGLTTLTPAQVVGTDVFFGFALSVVGGGIQFSANNFDQALLIKLLIGGFVGVLLGANLSAFMPARPLRLAMSLWLVSLGGQLCWRSFA
jgi:uncharacterized membrane protein YfcA